MFTELEQVYQCTYRAARTESAWLMEALGPFFLDNWITDILAKVKAGKEATVYCCAAHPATGAGLLAAKVYRPDVYRTMRNDAVYREGRQTLDSHGHVVTDRRTLRAVEKRTRHGRRTNITSWIEHEYQYLSLFQEAGVDVPAPYTHGGNVILMEYMGEAGFPAPTLQGVDLDHDEAVGVCRRVLANVETMLACGRVHADLSAYNVLYWQGDLRIIDFPQAVDVLDNPNAYAFLRRDLERLADYFRRYGIEADAGALADEYWARYVVGVGG